MFLTLQHPFTDLRWLLGPETGRLERPFWPLANPRSDFVRSSGRVTHRNRGGLREWAGEQVFSDASRALLFPDHLRDLSLGGARYYAKIHHALRRYYSNGQFARLEVGLRFNVWGYPSEANADVDKVSLLHSILELPIRACGKAPTAKTLGLVHAGDLLAEHFLFASTTRGVETQPWWFSAGSPAIVLDYCRGWGLQQLPLPPHTREVLDLPNVGIRLSHAWLKIKHQLCSTWIISRGREHGDEVRKLRMHLTRLHTERECLNTVLFQAKDTGKLEWVGNVERTEALQRYLNDALRVTERSERFGFDQSAMIDVAQRAHEIASEDLSLHEVRRQVAEKIVSHLRREQKAHTQIIALEGSKVTTTIFNGPVNTGGGDINVITAETINNSFNKVQASQASSDLKEALKEAITQVVELAKKLPQEQAQTVLKDLDAFTGEATSAKPRKAWYELSAKGILDAAKTVAALAGPVTTAVTAVLALLAG
ncbi:hypothetical protein [Pseudomonas sp. H9]|uniref:hypothetical protein n=1 Tax=Pseudomonas sp. H9 TaxID=483968 RepID=UPI00105810E9|nr:hypothetical protein [Pseudomonas sp. H9]TDF84396.1 hypothetical protein E1573_07655 [Pseudomonas sp. H9]